MTASEAAVTFSRLESAGFDALEIRCHREQYEITQSERPTTISVDYSVLAMYPLTLEQLTHLREAGLHGAGGPDGYIIRRYP